MEFRGGEKSFQTSYIHKLLSQLFFVHDRISATFHTNFEKFYAKKQVIMIASSLKRS